MYQTKNLFAEDFLFDWDNIIYLISIWQLMILLFLRHALEVTDPDGDDYMSAFFSVSRVHCFNLKRTTISCSFPLQRFLTLLNLFILFSTILFRFSCFEQLVFSCPATLWLVQSASCNVDNEDRWILPPMLSLTNNSRISLWTKCLFCLIWGTGGCSLGCSTSCFCATIRTTQGTAIRNSIRTSNSFPPGHCLTYIGKCITSSFFSNGFSTKTGNLDLP